ncbi:hypothetical protein V1525DRAFT_415670 [Lipomyces kononenkoae]|uniref:Uncharacterized protein n=1 Tax=Lipomyces kononenkoae TaxID=34357 RepID=A0ACC3SSH1_LIPKO
MAPIDPELEAVDLTTCDVSDDLQVVDINHPVPMHPTIAIDSENNAATKKKFKFSDKYPERDEVFLLELMCMEDKPYLSSHGDKLARWQDLANRCMDTFQTRCTDIPDGAVLTGRHARERFETLMKKQAEHIAWLDKASGVEVETTPLMCLREDVYEEYMSSKSAEGKKKADKEVAKVHADNLGKTIRDVAMRRLSEKHYDSLASSPTPANPESSASSTTSTPAVTSSAQTRKRRKIRYSSDEGGESEAFLEQGRQISDKIGEVMDVLTELRAQGRQLLDAALETGRGN